MRRRHKVALRPEARRERRARLAKGAAFLALASLLAYGYRRLPDGALRPANLLARLPVPDFLLVERVRVSGAPAAVSPALERALAPRAGRGWGPGTAASVEAELLERFGFLESATSDRDWSRRQVTVAVIPRTPVARVFRGGRAAGWLSDSGRVFEAPEGTFPAGLELPSVELEERSGLELPEVAAFVSQAGAQIPGGLRRVAFRPAERGCPQGPSRSAGEGRGEGCGSGWEVTTADGTYLLWGSLDWTDQKLERLREVLQDAGARFGPGLTADLRYFEDGRILVRPGSGPVARAR